MITKEQNPLDTYQPPSIEGGETYRQALEIQDFVNGSLRYSRDRRSYLEELEQPKPVRRTNCIGFTLAGSEWLEHAEIEHYLAVVNGHATTLVAEEGEDGTKLWLMDMLSPELNQPMNGLISPEELELTSSHGRSMVQVDGKKIAYGVYPPNMDFGKIVEDRHPWLALNATNTRPIGKSVNYKTKLVLGIYSPDVARQLLPAYARFRDATLGKDPEKYDLETAAGAVMEMPGAFPDGDIRGDSPKIIKSLVRRMALAGDTGRAEELTTAFFSSFDFSRDSRISEYQADCFRSIAKLSGAAGFIRRRFLLRQALDLYDEVSRRPHASSSIAGKIAACNSLAVDLIDESGATGLAKTDLQ